MHITHHDACLAACISDCPVHGPAQFSLRGPGAGLQGYSLYMALSAIHQQTGLKAELQGYSTT